MTVVVIRPYPDGKQLSEQLTLSGIQAYHFPVIDFSSGHEVDILPDLLSNSDLVIAVSKQAVYWAHRYLEQHHILWPVAPDYLAIGGQTAHALEKVVGFPVGYPKLSDSEHLLALPAFKEVKNKRILILRGNGGRELIYTQLIERGARVTYCEVYQRHSLSFDGHLVIQRWKEDKVDTFVITSAEQLRQLLRCVPVSDYSWLLQQRLIVPSVRIADEARQIGFNVILVSGSASNPDLLVAIQRQGITGQADDK